MYKNGGPAFPCPASTDEHEMACNIFDQQPGMSLRDYFAGQALMGSLAANPRADKPITAVAACNAMAMAAYDIADAMIRAREMT